MPKARKDQAASTPEDPDALMRTQAGAYRSADGRFEIERADTGWFVRDTTQIDELGQPLLRGPYATRDAARATLAEARKVTVLRPGVKKKVSRSRSRS